MYHPFFLFNVFQQGKNAIARWGASVVQFLFQRKNPHHHEEGALLTKLTVILNGLVSRPTTWWEIVQHKYPSWRGQNRDSRLWYLILGTPQSGKSRLLLETNLRLTRIPPTNTPEPCSAWQNEACVFVETSLPYATETSSRFQCLNLILRTFEQRRCGQNFHGILLTISVQDLLFSGANHGQMTEHLFQQLSAIYARPEHTPPLYVIVTQSDLIPGFHDFFTSFDSSEREQVLGCTLPDDLNADIEGKLEILQAMLESLNRHLNQGLIHKLTPKVNMHQAHQIMHFGQYFATTRAALHHFLQSIFTDPNPVRTAKTNPPLRGIYFTSCIDKKIPQRMGAAAKHTTPFATTSSAHSYFLHRLLTEVIFKERHLVACWQQKPQKTHQAWNMHLKSALLGSAFCTAGLWLAHQHETQKLQALLPVPTQVATTPSAMGSHEDWTTLFDSSPAAQTPHDTPLDLSTKIVAQLHLLPDQQPVIADAIRGVHRQWVREHFLPFFLKRLEQHWAVKASNSAQNRYRTLRIYRMLEQPTHWNKNTITDWIQKDGVSIKSAPLSDALDELHLLLQLPATAHPVLPENQLAKPDSMHEISNGLLIQLILNDRVEYISTSATPATPTLLATLGPTVGSVLQRGAEQTWAERIPFEYTALGNRQFHEDFSNWLSTWCQEARWILDHPQMVQPEFIQHLQIEAEHAQQQRHEAYWLNFISHIKLRLNKDASDVVAVSRWLSAGDSPLPALLQLLQQATAPVTLGSPITNPSSLPPYAHLTAESMVTLINELYVELSNMETARTRDIPMPLGHSIERLKAEGTRWPEPFHTVFLQLYTASVHYQQTSLQKKEAQNFSNPLGASPE